MVPTACIFSIQFGFFSPQLHQHLHPHSTCHRTHTLTTVLLLFWNLSGTTWVSRYQKGKTRKVKTNLDLLEQEIVSGSGICWAICKSAPHPRQQCQHPTTQFFTGRMPFLSPNQQRQSTEGTASPGTSSPLTPDVHWHQYLRLCILYRLLESCNLYQ